MVLLSRSVRFLCLLFVSFVIIGSALAEVPAPSAVRAVQCGAFPTREEADLCKSRLATLGYGPIWEAEQDGFIKILVGKCENYVDTVILRDKLRQNMPLMM